MTNTQQQIKTTASFGMTLEEAGKALSKIKIPWHIWFANQLEMESRGLNKKRHRFVK